MNRLILCGIGKFVNEENFMVINIHDLESVEDCKINWIKDRVLAGEVVYIMLRGAKDWYADFVKRVVASGEVAANFEQEPEHGVTQLRFAKVNSEEAVRAGLVAGRGMEWEQGLDLTGLGAAERSVLRDLRDVLLKRARRM